MTDVMVHARTRTEKRVLIGVEGKAREGFDKPIADWVRKDQSHPTKSRQRRLDFLNSMLGLSGDLQIQTDSTIQYQLLHRTASVVYEAGAHAAMALLLIHSFNAEKDDNWSAFRRFTEHLKVPPFEKGVVSDVSHLGPEGNVPTHFLWVEDSLTSAPQVTE